MGKLKSLEQIVVKNAKHEYRKIKARIEGKKCLKNVSIKNTDIDQQYKDKVLPFWSKYGIKPKKMWYRLFADKYGNVDPRYIPDDIWFSDIIPKFCKIEFLQAYEDKCMYHVHFPNLKKPETVIKRVNGIFYDENLNLLSKELVLKLCMKENNLIFKPSIGSGKGKKIQVYRKNEITYENILQTINSLGDNFIVQKIVKQHEVLEQLHKDSLNTIRVLSFFFKRKVYILSSILRVGVGNSRIDNVSAGGLQCEIRENGELAEYAYGVDRKKYKCHPEGAVFGNIQLPGYQAVLNLVRKEHTKLPYFQIIGWDFAIGEDEEPIFIEFNVCPWQNQMTCGPTFGNMTEKILDEVFINKNKS